MLAKLNNAKLPPNIRPIPTVRVLCQVFTCMVLAASSGCTGIGGQPAWRATWVSWWPSPGGKSCWLRADRCGLSAWICPKHLIESIGRNCGLVLLHMVCPNLGMDNWPAAKVGLQRYSKLKIFSPHFRRTFARRVFIFARHHCRLQLPRPLSP